MSFSAADSWGTLRGASAEESELQARPEPVGTAEYPAKIYVEPTSRCNLNCRTCIRNVWDESMGWMSRETFARVLDGARACPPPLTLFFGGYGEPLFHPEIVGMVRAAKAAGASVELITNGMLLTGECARGLIAAGLDVLWVSLDGAKPESYADVRLGAALPDVIANVAGFRDLRSQARPEIGIAFVAMRRNMADLPALLRLGRELGASRFMVTNVLPYTPEMRSEILYARALSNGDYYSVPDLPDVRLPRIDGEQFTNQTLLEALRAWGVSLTGNGARIMGDHCPFIVDGAVAVGWDGHVSPCLPLLHTCTGYLHGYERTSRRYVVGNVNDQPLFDLWRAPEHVRFRERVRTFDFSPCTLCDGCLLSESNEQDCYGNAFPTCGGCLWAQGIVQCP
jgi:MoaA/NifB/PqqE/SkfB family radical SAM enzyme